MNCTNPFEFFSPRELCFEGSSLLTDAWWAAMTFVSVLNIRATVNQHCFRKHDSLESPMLKKCATAYIFACALRAILPRRDGERTCFFDSLMSIPLIGRIAATVAEIAFGHQLATVLSSLAHKLRCWRTKKVLKIVVPVVSFAQVLCWISVTTRRQNFHVFEETLWLIMMQLCGFCSLVLANELRGTQNRSIQRKLVGGFIFSACFSLFMALVDVPM